MPRLSRANLRSSPVGRLGSSCLFIARVVVDSLDSTPIRGQSEDTMPETRAATDAAMSGLSWVVGESYKVHDAVDRLSVGRWSGLPGYYNPKDHGRDSSGQWVRLHPYNYKLQPTEFWVRLIEDASPDPRTRTPRVWSPS